MALGDPIGLLDLLRDDAGDLSAFLAGRDQDGVGEHVERLLRFALDVGRGGDAAHRFEPAAAHDVGNRLAGILHVIDEGDQVRVDAAARVLRADEEVGQGGVAVPHGVPCLPGAAIARRRGWRGCRPR